MAWILWSVSGAVWAQAPGVNPAFDREMTLAEQGHGPSQYGIGLKYELGRGVTKDMFGAIEWFEKAAEQDHVLALFHVAMIYHGDKGAEYRDERKAYKRFKHAAELGNLSAMFYTGVYHEEGKGSATRSDKRAAEWYMRAAKQGHRSCQRKLAYVYLNGVGFPKDYTESLYWCQIAQKGVSPQSLDKMPLDNYWRILMGLTGEREQRKAREKAAKYRPERSTTKAKGTSLGKDVDGKLIYFDLINQENKLLRAAVINIKGMDLTLKRESDQKDFTIKLSTLSNDSQRMIRTMQRQFPASR